MSSVADITVFLWSIQDLFVTTLRFWMLGLKETLRQMLASY